MNEKRLIQTARTLSTLFSPFYASEWILFVLFFFSYLRLLPLDYRLMILVMVYAFTVLIPKFGINAFRILNKWTHWQLSHREHRHMPYLLTVLSYTVCLYIMTTLNVVMFIRGVVMAALVSQLLCALINVWWKVSTHMVGMGGLVGSLIAFSLLFYYNPVWPTCLLLLISGALGTSRIVLRQHTLEQVVAGFGIGFVCSMFFILISWM